MKTITKEQQQLFPKVMTTVYFKEGTDKRDAFNERYRTEEVVNNPREESKVYENLNHGANITVLVKLPNGIII